MGLRLAGEEERRKSLNQIDGFFSLDPFSRALSIFTGGASDVALVVAQYVAPDIKFLAPTGAL